MKPMRIAAPGVLLLCMASCAVGSNAAQEKFASHPEGVTVTFQTQSAGRSGGELLEARDDGLVVGSRNRILFVPFATLQRLTTGNLGAAFSLDRGGPPSEAKLAKIRAVSHFPQGMTPEMLRVLLARAGQSELMVLK